MIERDSRVQNPARREHEEGDRDRDHLALREILVRASASQINTALENADAAKATPAIRVNPRATHQAVAPARFA